MTKERYMTLSAAALKDIAKARGVKHYYAMKKDELIETMLAMDTAEEVAKLQEKVRESRRQDAGTERRRKGGHAAGPERKSENEKSPERKSENDKSQDRKSENDRSPEQKTENDKNAERNSETAKGAQPRTEGAEGRGHKAANAGRVIRKRKGAGNETAKSTETKEEAPGSAETAGPETAGTEAAGTETAGAAVKEEARKPEQGGRGRGRASRGRRSGAREPRREETDGNAEPETAAVPQDTPDAKNSAEAAEAPAETRDESRAREGSRTRGILEVMSDGFGFLRSDNFLPGDSDVYVSPSQIRRFNLKTGDMVSGFTRDRAQGEKFGALLYVESVNGFPAEEARTRPAFEHMTPEFPHERIRLERPDGTTAARIVDLISPIGKGQRGMIVSPPKAGKTTLLKDIANSILYKDPEANLIILLVDERPEEVTDMKETVHGKNVEIIYSTFDELPDHHKRVSEMVIERAKRLVEHKQDVVILLDSITRLARACNILVPPSGKTLSGGLDPTALYMPKRFFGAARKMREGGSLTILATALVDTGSKMDDVVYEEFKGTGNMELILDRKLQERRIFPAIDIAKSGTRREDLLLTPEELEAVGVMRRSLSGIRAEEAADAIINMFSRLKTNSLVIQAILSRKMF